jgi:hypothetical protein
MNVAVVTCSRHNQRTWNLEIAPQAIGMSKTHASDGNANVSAQRRHPSGVAVDALQTAGVLTALSVSLAPWQAVMAAGIVLAIGRTLIELVPILLSHRRASANDNRADQRLQMLITLRGSGIAVSTQDFLACAHLGSLYLAGGATMSQSTDAKSPKLTQVD